MAAMTTAADADAHPPPTPPPPPAPVPTPRPKHSHSRTSSLQPGPVPVSAEHGAASPSQSGGGVARRTARTAPPDPLSDKATAFLIRRVLCPQNSDKGRGSPAPIQDILPPLSSRNDVDLQLYALIAIILREYVQNWYTKITADETFVAEIVQIIAHITRALEQRLRKVDLESLLFDELPELLDNHVTAYRASHDPITQPPVQTDPREIYHSLCPLPALSPVLRSADPESAAAQAENEAAYRQLLVQAVLAVLLPTEDLQNGCLTALVGQIFSELIIGNAVSNRLSEPWLIWELLIIVSRTGRGRSISEDGNLPGKSRNGLRGTRRALSLQAVFWTILQWCFLATSLVRTAFAILVMSRSLPPRVLRGAGFQKDKDQHEVGAKNDPQASNTPVLAFRLWCAISNLTEMDARMPWLCGALSMLQWIAMTGPGRIAAFNGRLDRLLSYSIHTYVLNAANLPPLLRNVRGALFPNNMASNKAPLLVAPTSDTELRALRRRCARSLLGMLPRPVGRLFFGGRLRGRATATTPTTTAATTNAGDSRKVGEREGRAAKGGTESGPTGSAWTGSAGSSPTRSAPSGPKGIDDRHRRRRRHDQDQNQGQGQDQGQGPCTTPRSSVEDAGASTTASASGGTTTVDMMTRDDYDDRDGGDDTDGNSYRDQNQEAEDDGEILDEIERSILDVFSDAYCNKHLVYAILELVLVRLMPELAEKGVVELLSDRITL